MTKITAPNNRIIIFDTTLRDGEQAPGYSLSSRQKLRLAKVLAGLGVDVLEAGFAAASPDDFEAIRSIAEEVDGPIIASLARCVDADIHKAAAAIKPAAKGRIHTFLATSPLHRQFKLNMTTDQVIERIRQGVRLAKNYTDDVEFSCEDATRTEPDFLIEAIDTAITAGATTINLPDTVGYATPDEVRAMFARVRQAFPDPEIIFSTHCHNDLGLAVANSLAAIEGGARQIECSVNGIGERAGNCALEEVVMAIKTRSDRFDFETGIHTPRLSGTSRLLGSMTGQPVARNKAIVGKNAFAHESGIHQHGVLKNPETYEIMRPEDVGASTETLVLGKHSGRAAVQTFAHRLGLELDEETLARVFADFKILADRKKEVTEADIEALIMGGQAREQEMWSFEALHTGSHFGDGAKASAHIRLKGPGGEDFDGKGEGDGPFEAVFNVVRNLTGLPIELEQFQIRSVSSGEDALGEADVQIRLGAEIFHGRGLETDIIAAGAKAVIDVINRIERRKARLGALHPATAHTTAFLTA